MGASANITQNAASSIVDAYTNMVMEQIASCSSTLAQNQHINISNLHSSGPVVISGIKMNQHSVMSPNCASNLTGSQKTKSAVANLQAQVAKAISHATPLNISANASFNTSDMVTQVLSHVKDETIQKCVNNAYQNQAFDTKDISGSSIKIGGIDMNQANKSVSKCVFKSVQKQLGDIKALSSLQQVADSKSKLINTGIVVAVVVGIVVLVIAGIVAYIVYQRSKKQQENEERSLKKNMAEKGIDTKDVVKGGEGGGSGGGLGGLGGGGSNDEMMATAAKLAMASTPEGAALSMLL